MKKKHIYFKLKQAVSSLLVAGLIGTLMPMGTISNVQVVEAATPASQDFDSVSAQDYNSNTVTFGNLVFTTSANGRFNVGNKQNYGMMDTFVGSSEQLLNAASGTFIKFASTSTSNNFNMGSVYLNTYNSTITIYGYDNGSIVTTASAISIASNGQVGSGNAGITVSNAFYGQYSQEYGVTLTFTGTGWDNVDAIKIDTGDGSSPIIDEIVLADPVIPFSMTADSYSLTEDVDTSKSNNVLTNDTGYPLYVTTISHSSTGSASVGILGASLNGAVGTLAMGRDGAFTYTVNSNSTTLNQLSVGQSYTETFTYTATDGVSSSTKNIVFTISGSNDRPAGSDFSINMYDNSDFVFASSDFVLNDSDNVDQLSGIKITELPQVGKGVLRLNGNPVQINDIILANQLSQLYFIPATNAYGRPLTTIQFRVMDNSGAVNNTSSTDNTVYFYVARNTTPPPFAVIAPVSGAVIGGLQFTASGTSESNTTIYLEVGADTYTTVTDSSGNWSKTITASSDGTTQLNARAIDANQVSSGTTQVTFTLDNTGPTVTLNQVADGALVNTNTVTFSGNTEANAAMTIDLDNQQYSFNADANGDFSYTINNVAEGENHFIITASDQYQNQTVDSRSFTVDTTPPAVTGVQNNNTHLVPVTPTFADGVGQLTIAGVGTDSFLSGSTIYEDGEYTLVVTDAAGNSTTVHFYIDQTPPTVTGVTNGSTYAQDVTIQFSDGFGFVSRNGNTSTSIQSGDTISADGEYALHVEDLYGNAVDYTFTIDQTAPEAPTISLSPTTPTNFLVSVGISYPTDAAQKLYRLGESGNWSSFTGFLLLTENVTIYAKAIDAAGNETVTSMVVSNIDHDNPYITITSPTTGTLINENQVTLTGTGEPFAEVRIRVGFLSYSTTVDAGGNWSYVAPVYLEGESEISAYTRDAAGNDSETVTLSVTVDTVKPAISITTPSTRSLGNSRQVTFEGTGEPGLTIDLKIAGTTYQTLVDGSGEWRYTVTLPSDGTFTVVAEAEDAAGNQTRTWQTTTLDRGIVDIAFDTDGSYYVANNVTNRIQKYDRNGQFLFDLTTTSGQEIIGVSNLVVSPNHELYVADSFRDVIKVFNSTGTLIRIITQVNNPRGMAFDANGNLYAVDGLTEEIIVIDAFENVIERFGGHVEVGGVFYIANDLAIDNRGYVYVVDYLQGKVVVFDENHHLVNEFATPGTGEGQLSAPYGIAIDGDNNIYVTEVANPRISKFNQAGQFLAQISEAGSAFGRISIPAGITIGPGGQMFVCDYEAGQLIEFSPQVLTRLRTIEIDTVAPVITGVIDNASTTEDVTISFTDGTGSIVKDQGNPTAFSSGSTISEAGQYVLSVTDAAGNVSTVTFTIQSRFPVISGVSNNGVYNTTKTPTFNIGTAVIAKDGGASYAFASGTTVTEDGEYVLTVTNTGNLVTTVTFTIDQVNPVVSGVSNNGIYNAAKSPTFNEGTATLSKDGGTATAFTSGTSINEDGAYELTVSDAAGNVTTVTFTIDQVNPIVSGVSNNGIYNAAKSPTFNEGTATLSKDGGTATAFTSGTSITEDGEYVLTVTDAAGNVTTVSFTIDQSNPIVSGVSNNGIYNAAKTPSFNEGTATLSKDGAAANVFTSGNSITEDGSYVLTVTDAAGNVTTVTFTIDQVNPIVSGVSNNGIYNAAKSPTFNEGTATLSKDGGTATAFTSGTPIIEDGEYELKVTDAAGNETTATFTIDTIAPAAPSQLEVVGSLNGRTKDNTPTIQGVAEANATVTLWNEGELIASIVAGADGKWSYTFGTLSDGRHSLSAKASDAAGNASADSELLTFDLDATAPAVPEAPDLVASRDSGASDTDNVTSFSTLILSGYAEADAMISIYANGGLIASGGVNADGYYQLPTSSLEDGVYEIRIRVTDAAGNTTESSTTLTVKVDTVAGNAPTVSKSYTSDGLVVTIHYPNDAYIRKYNLGNGTFSDYDEAILLTGQTYLWAYAEDQAGNISIHLVLSYLILPDTTIQPGNQIQLSGNDAKVSFNGGAFAAYETRVLDAEGTYLFYWTDDFGMVLRQQVTTDSIPPVVTGVESNKYYTNSVTPIFTEGTGNLFENGVLRESYTSGTPITEDGSYMLFVIDLAGNLTMVQFVIDRQPPARPNSTVSHVQATNQDVIVSIDYPEDAAGKEVKIGEGDWQPYTGPITMTSNGQIYARSTDASGNVSEQMVTNVSNIDKTAPVVTGVSNRQVYANEVTISFDEGEALLTRLGEEAIRIESGYTVTEEGTYQLIVSDAVGNRTSRAFVIDYTRPVAPSVTVSTTTVTKSPVVVRIEFPSDALRKEYRLGDGDWQTYTSVLVIAENTTVYARAVDAVGLVSEITERVISNIDTEAPDAPTKVELLDKKYVRHSSSATVTGIALQAVKVSIYVDGEYRGSVEPGIDGSWDFELSRLSEGAHSVFAVALDEAGNESQPTQKFEIVVDLIAPNISGVSQGKAYNTNVTPTFTEGTAKIRRNDGLAIAYSSGVTLNLEGSYVLELTDEAGNVDSVAFTIDKTVPVLSGVREGGLYGSPVTLSFSEGSSWLLKVGGGSLEVTSGTIVSVDATYVWTVTDAAGNRTSVSFVLDQAGFIPKFTPSKTTSTREPITFTVTTGNAGYSTEYKIGESGSWKAYVGAVTLTQNARLFARAKALNGLYSDVVSYDVTNIVQAVSAVKVDRTAVELAVRQSAQLNVTVLPETATNKAVTWTSSNAKVAKVDKYGKVTAVATGTATITARSVDSGRTANVKVAVVVPVTGLKLNATSVKLKVKKSTQLVATVSPKTATIKAVTWTSSNPAIAKVDAKGKVTALKLGKVVITAKTKSGSKVATCTITVSK